MTRIELNNLIASFNKQPGEYTEDELLEIGKAHRSLPQEEKNWNSLAEELGLDKSGNGFRCWVKNRMYKEGTIIPKALGNKKLIENSTTDNIEFNINAQLEELYKEQVRTRDVYNAYRRGLREEARIESLKDCIRDTVKDLKGLKTIEYGPITPMTLDKEAILMFSDLHIGVECNNFYNAYNTDIAIERINKLVADTITYCRINHVKKLHILNLGDLIHGIIHTSARIEQEMDVVKQVMVAAELVANMLNSLQQAAPEIIYRSVLDNHSRVIANKNDHIELENLNKIIDWFVQERLKATNIKFMFDNLDAGLGKFTLNNGKKVVFAHGHQDNINTALQGYIGATKEFIDYILLAHYHSEKVKAFQGCKVIVNGSIVGTEQYALSKRLFNEPSQILLISDRDNLINISINLK